MTATATTATASGKPVGKIRSPLVVLLLQIVTFGIYGLVWYYKTHQEMKEYSGQGLGGGLALVLALFAGIVMPYVTSAEVGNLYAREGQEKPVSGKTGLWVFPGIFIIVGPFIWLWKTQGALNRFWESKGATS